MADLTETSGKCRGRGRPFEKGVSGNPGGRPKGDAHPALFAHPVFHGLPILRDFFDRQWPADGSTDTVNAGAFRFTNPDGAYVDSHGPAMRAIYDLADLDRSVFLIALGQSAHVLSPHYADFLPRWRSFNWVRLPHDAQGQTLVLTPKANLGALRY